MAETTTYEEEPWHDTVAGVMGNVLEWYDFALFGFFSDVIANVFFPPSDDEHGNLLKSFCIFGGAFVMRPVGGLVIGYVGDKHGRREALTKSLFMMAIPTTLMGCLPSYETAGWISTLLLVLCRLVQGVSVGGQLPASLVYTVEKRDPSQWGYYGSLPMVAANVGTLLGNLCGAFMRQVLSDEQLESWGWRLPFFSGILIAGVAAYLKATGKEVHTTAGVYDGDDSKIKNPITAALAPGNRMALLSTSLTPMLWASGFYVSFVWMAIFMDELNEPPVPGAFWVNAISMLLGMTFMLPIAGGMSDRVGRVPIMTFAGVGLTFLGPVLLLMISKGNALLAFFCQFILGVLLSFFGGPLCAWLVENFSPEVRLTSASLGYDLAHALVGGFSPAIATALYINVGKVAPSLIYVVFGVVSVFGLYLQHFCGDTSHLEEQNRKKDPTNPDLELPQPPAQIGPDVVEDLPEIA